MKKRMLTGLQPSGALHIGNYFGALKPAVELAREYDSMVMVADLHALTTLKDPAALKANIISGVKDYIGAGLDPTRTVIFQQSQVHEHTELAWIFECLVTVPFLQQAHAYKDKVAKGLEANAGLFNYPMLMAADILLYDTDIVPVGSDQRQHVEYAREAAMKFNLAYGGTFKEPKEHILESVSIVFGTDGKKMSKSYGNTIPLFGTKDEIVKAVMSIVTKMGGITPANVYSIHLHVRCEVYDPKADATTFNKLYADNKNNYKFLKEVLIEDLEKMIAPLRVRRDAVSDADVKRILKEGSDKAREQAAAKMRDVREKIGVTL